MVRRIDSSDSESDSDDDVPLSQLRAAAKQSDASAVKSEPAIKAEAPIKKEAGASATPSKPSVSADSRRTAVKRDPDLDIGDTADSDSDSDNVPISQLAPRNKRVKVEVKAEPAATVRTAAKSPARAPQKKKKRAQIQFKQQECTEELYGTLKGRLAQELLCRWWYAIEWPPQDTKTEHLHGVQELDGFQGAYIRVKGDDMGSILDTRQSRGKPSFLHFFALPSAEIQQLLIQAYEKQIEALTEHEPSNTSLLKELKSALTSASKISAGKADRSVTKVLKKYARLAANIQQEQDRINAATEEDAASDGDEDADDNDDDTSSAEDVKDELEPGRSN